MISLVINPSQQDGTEEKLITPIAKALYDLLKADNLIYVTLLPLYQGNDESALYQAIQASNAINPDYHLAIHADAGAYARGASGIYFSENGKKFITPITQIIMDNTPWSDVGVKYRDDLGELKNTTAIAGLIELSFYDNSEELAWMKNNVDKIAQLLRDGIYKSLNIQKETPFDLLYSDLEKVLNKHKKG